MNTPKVLLVDDEPRVLASLTRELMEMEFCEVLSAQSGAAALERLQITPDVAVICSDFHMPGMDGVSFLVRAQQECPDATRIILTGVGDLDTAIEAVNRGKVFRFLLKPCPADVFVETIKAAIRQHQLVTAERELLNRTLSGSIKILTDILSMLYPEIFNQANRLRPLAHKLAVALGYEQIWEVDLAALLCKIGAVTIPQETIKKWLAGEKLSPQERAAIDAIPHTGAQLLQGTPRFQNVSSAILYQNTSYDGKGVIHGETIPPVARMLKIVLDYDDYYISGMEPADIYYNELLRRAGQYDPHQLETFRSQVLKIGDLTAEDDLSSRAGKRRRVKIEDLESGMILVNNIVDRNGRLILSKGTVITEIHQQKLRHFSLTHSQYETIVAEMIE